MQLLRFALFLLCAAPFVAAEAAADLATGGGASIAPEAQQEGERASPGQQQQKKKQGPQQPREVPTDPARKVAAGDEAPPDSGRPGVPEEQPVGAPPETTGASREAPTNTLPEAFARFDLNGDGRLGPGERRAAREALDPMMSAKDPATAENRGLPPIAVPAVPKLGAAAGREAASRRGPAGEARSRSSVTDSISRLQAIKEIVAEERERREARVVASRERLVQKSADREPKKSARAVYRELAKYQPRAPASSGKSWAPTSRQGISHGKKRGSAYYQQQISRSGRGGGRGRGNNRNNQRIGY